MENKCGEDHSAPNGHESEINPNKIGITSINPKMKLKIILFASILLTFVQCTGPGQKSTITKTNEPCICDTTKVMSIIKSDDFNRIELYDKDSSPAESLYMVNAIENKRLWYRDVENPEPTKFTKYWNDYVANNYRANQHDFVNYYKGKENIEIAFQFGPNEDLWAYHIFVVKKVDCCYLITRSYFRHARFTYKAFSILDQPRLDSLFQVIDPIKKSSIDTAESWNNCGYFADNRNKTGYYIDFVKEVDVKTQRPKQEIMNLYNFVDKRIKWKVTYE
jgi:hypothetical protein